MLQLVCVYLLQNNLRMFAKIDYFTKIRIEQIKKIYHCKIIIV